ncbi:CsbD family protein [Hymenobacter oligotrophus]|uniref:CsbD family protein n=1 Tax=Hymenobacter oligotrophus TaxID=2319843 RepID=A0A3B7R1A5_9BACT|nr:YtxH domain-containing protein [Hymenobacter oligotrophus]AYA37140.1 CsbD family protein [Hymenobacter oligotrophus]
MSYNEDNNSGKILLAVLAGASAGIVAGLLMAPDKGSATRGNLKNYAGKYGDQLNDTLAKLGTQLDTSFKGLAEKLEDLGVTGAGASLNMKGDWNVSKGKLKQQYAQLTDDDLTYTEGAADDLVGRLQDKLGKSKREIVKLLNDL